MQKATARKGVFYGWFIVAAGFFTMFVSAGARNGFGVFIIPMSDDLHLSRGAISAAIAIGWLVNGLTQPLLGRFYDRLGGRTVISYSLLVLGGTTMLLSLTNNIWMLVFLYGFVMSTAASGASLVTIGAIMSKWFYRKRGRGNKHNVFRGFDGINDTCAVRGLPDYHCRLGESPGA